MYVFRHARRLSLSFVPVIVEDEPLIPFELKVSVEEASGRAIGPVGGVEAALIAG